jgi:hypothetical protein
MKKTIVTAVILAATTSVAFAQAPDSDTSLTGKAMKDQPGTTGGSTTNPTVKPGDGSAATKAMKDQPGTTGGNTTNPTAKPEDGSATTKAMKDQPGTK